MKIEEQYRKMQELKEYINSKLKTLSFEDMKALIQWTINNKEYRKLKTKDNQLIAFDFFVLIWSQEKKEPNSFEMQGDIFYGVNSLEDIEQKYLTAKFAIYRIENGLPYEYCVSALDELIRYRFSGFSLYAIIMRESWGRISTFVELSRLLKQQNQYVKAIGLLQKGLEMYPKEKDLVLELADCWMENQQWKKAYECLVSIHEGEDDLQEMIRGLEKVLQDEKV